MAVRSALLPHATDLPLPYHHAPTGPIITPFLLSLNSQVIMDQVMAVRSALLHAAGGNLWQPLDFNAGAIGRAFGGDAEVNQALEQLLVPGQRDQVCGLGTPRGLLSFLSRNDSGA